MAATTRPKGSTLAVTPSFPALRSQRPVSTALSLPMAKCCLPPKEGPYQASLVRRTRTLAPSRARARATEGKADS
ncbi:hypothetical protein QT17_08000 [Thermus sp. 2.9]|nr:hypothetical protein QT17_08000 [Thermus sp. 2.9]